MKRILIIGGTGMLRDATDHFISNNFHVSIIARNTERLRYFTQKHPDKKAIDLISLDYCNTENFLNEIELNIKQHGSFDIVISWIHSNATNSLLQLMSLIAKHNSNTLFYHVKGSSYFETDNYLNFNATSATSKLDYHEIYLGFKIVNGISRWLTNTEISKGIIEAVELKNTKTIIGQIEPIKIL